MKGHRPPRHPTAAPAHALTFADLMVNLLAFFVLLFSWSAPPAVERIAEGLGGFLTRLDSLGVEADEEGSERRIQDLESRLSRWLPRSPPRPREKGRASPSSAPFRREAVLPLEIRFAPGLDRVEPDDRVELRRLAASLRPETYLGLRIEVALPAQGTAEEFALAGARARALRDVLGAEGLETRRIFIALGHRDDRAGRAPEVRLTVLLP